MYVTSQADFIFYTRRTNMNVPYLDKLPASVRHFIIGVFTAFAGTIATAIFTKMSVFGVDWNTTLKHAVDAAVLGGITMTGILHSTGLTAQYGVGKNK
jgi:hypothetical protein